MTSAGAAQVKFLLYASCQPLGQRSRYLNELRLVVVEEVDDNLYLATRNLKHVDVVDVQGLNPVSLIGFEKVLFTVGALKKAEEKFA